MDVAEIIMQQLGGSGKLKAMLDAKNFVYGDNSLQFDIGPGANHKANKVQIKLDNTDTYTLSAFRYHRKTLQCPIVAAISNIYSNNLKTSLETLLGMHISL